MSIHQFILNTFKMYFDVNKEPLNQHITELLDMVDLGINPIASEYNLNKQYSREVMQDYKDLTQVIGQIKEEDKLVNAIYSFCEACKKK